MKSLINRFNKDYPNGSIQVQRIMMEIPEKGEVSKVTIQPDVNNSQRFFT
jgi:aspartate 1-decarboxylase